MDLNISSKNYWPPRDYLKLRIKLDKASKVVVVHELSDEMCHGDIAPPRWHDQTNQWSCLGIGLKVEDPTSSHHFWPLHTIMETSLH